MSLTVLVKKYIAVFLIILAGYAYGQNSKKNNQVNFIRLSQDLLHEAKIGDNASAYINILKNANENDLAAQLNTDFKRLAFWLNIYNGFTQVILKNNPDQYKTRSAFFGSEQIKIAGKDLSLNMIEHGILRRSKIKWSMGYLTKLFPSSYERKFRVDKLDYRIHFALNCGAKSCPPIALYKPEEINNQLNVATETYLKGESKFDSAAKVVRVPALMSWFKNDFGGNKGIIRILIQNKIIPKGSNPAIEFKEYDWSLHLNNYKS